MNRANMNSANVTRRRFLGAALAAGALAVAESPFRTLARARQLTAHDTRLTTLPTINDVPRFAPVKVARNRIIRTVVGLRPYRKEGFVVEAERLGNKLLVHNYGHGGAGVTLSWGTSSLAVDIARDYVSTAPPLRGQRRASRRSAHR